jgi:hypothetical protein
LSRPNPRAETELVGPQTWAGHQDGLLDEIEQLLKELGDDEDELDRLLATGLFTDIVRPTERTAKLEKMHPISDDRQSTRPGLIRRDSVRDRMGSRHIPRVRR